MSTWLGRFDSTVPADVFASPPVRDAAPARSQMDIILRSLDVAIAGLALIMALPLMLLVVLAMKLFDKGPILFAHPRVGKDLKLFNCLKFRTMVVDSADRLDELLERCPVSRETWARDRKLANDPRITWIGSFLRKSSLDELPQLVNVLRGEMSLVGPRPIVMAEVHRYGRYIRTYHSVRPGITGLWQISGRNNISYRRRVAMDVAFARSLSVPLYLRILGGTVPAVLLARGSC